jgi:chromate transporter
MPDDASRNTSLPIARPGSAAEVFGVALRLGLTAFGGPIAHLGCFRAEYVARRGWLDDRTYSELIGLCQFLPGPASSQLGFAIGWQRAGFAGALAAWLGFTLPSALLMLGCAIAAGALGGPVADAATHGLKVAAVAVVAQAIVGMARTLTPDLRRVAIAALAAAVMLAVVTPSTQLVLIALGAVAGMAFCTAGAVPPVEDAARSPTRGAGLAALTAFAIILLALPLFTQAGGWLRLGGVFYRAGALVFGGGHVVLPLLREGLVPVWMDDAAFLSGYGAAQIVPGPLFAVAGYLGAVARPATPLAGAALATVAIFLPGLLLITGALAFRGRIAASGTARRAIAGVNAVVVGLLAAALYDPLWTTGIVGGFDIVTAGIALVALLRFRAPPLLAVALCVAANLALIM